MKKLSVCVLFGGVSPEHEVSLRSAESVLNNLNPEKYNIFPVGITRDGQWILFGGSDYSMLPNGAWESCPRNRRAALSPVRGQGLLSFENDCVVRERIDVVFPVLHGENGEDGSMQGLLQIAGIAYVGSGVGASSACMDKSMTKLIAANAGILQARWQVIRAHEWARDQNGCMDAAERTFSYPVFVKPAGTGSSVGIFKAKSREELELSVADALRYGKKVLVEEFIDGQEIEVAVLGNEEPVASCTGRIIPANEFYDYEAKYSNSESKLLIPSGSENEEYIRSEAVRAYKACDCKGLSRVDFLVSDSGEIYLNEINTIPGFTSISMYPKLFDASGIPYPELIDRLLRLAVEFSEKQ